MRVLLVSMPFGALDRPALGISLLKPVLATRGIHCDIRYLNLEFACLIGADEYRWVSTELPYTAFAGDWIFTEPLYGPRPEADAAYINQILRSEWRLGNDAIRRVMRIRKFAAPFLSYALSSVNWRDYDAVGFTSTFEQNVASLALARDVKLRHPDVLTLFGGANWEGDMGLALLNLFHSWTMPARAKPRRAFPRSSAA